MTLNLTGVHSPTNNYTLTFDQVKALVTTSAFTQCNSDLYSSCYSQPLSGKVTVIFVCYLHVAYVNMDLLMYF